MTPKPLQEAPRRRPRTLQEGLRQPQTSPRSAQTPPQDASKPAKTALKIGFGSLRTDPSQKYTLLERNLKDFGALWEPFLTHF